MTIRIFQKTLINCIECPVYKNVKDGLTSHHSYCYFMNKHSEITTDCQDSELKNWFEKECPLEKG